MPKSLKFGLYTAVAGILLSLLFLVLSLDTVQGLQWIGLIFTIAFLYLGIKDKRDNEQNGMITLGEGFKRGAAITVIASLISSIYTALYLYVINPGFKEHALDQQYEKFVEQGMDDDQIEMAMGMTDRFFEIFGTVGSLVGGIFIGLIISLIIALILRKETAVQ